MERENLEELLKKYELGQATPEEQAIVEEWYERVNDDQPDLEFNSDPIRMLKDIENVVISKNKPNHFKSIAIAASILVAGIAGILLYQSKLSNSSTSQIELAIDLEPGTNKATLKTADGQFIDLSNQHSGIVMDQEYISYNDGTPILTESAHNYEKMLELTTPNGGEYQVKLPDGTKVWLNAATTLKYPSRFNGAERRVVLSGEAYFEVAKNAKSPFIVESPDQEIKVLGTHFNVNSFKDEGSVLTTLIEGSIQITQNKTKESLILKPKEQAILGDKGIQVKQVNTEHFTSWKAEVFIFDDASLKSILLSLSRWYNFKVDGTKIPNAVLSGEVMRNVPLSEVLQVLEKISKVPLQIVSNGTERRIEIRQ